MWGEILKRDLLGLSREEDKFHSKEELQEYLKSEVKRQGKNVVIRDLDVSLIEDLSDLFSCRSLFDESLFGSYYDTESLDLSGWKTSNVKNMNFMFGSCWKLKSLDLSGWDTSNVEDMNWMFYGCKNLKSLDVTGWNTSNVKDMSCMFYGCENLESLDLSGWDTSNVEDMRGMFSNCLAPYRREGNKIVRKA